MHSDRVTTTASEGRKSSKPIMEKRRRARINASLAELKSLLLEVIKKEGARHSKMEKADILEMTVKHLRQLQKQQLVGSTPPDPSIFSKYRLGFNECASEVSRYLSTLADIDVDLRARVISHLSNCVMEVSSTSQADPSIDSQPSPLSSVHPSSTTNPIVPTSHVTTMMSQPMTLTSRAPSQVTSGITSSIEVLQPTTSSVPVSYLGSPDVSSTQGVHNQNNKIFGGLQLIQTKLPNGEMAFVLPTNVISGGHVPSYVIPVYASQTLNPGVLSPSGSTGSIIGQPVTFSSVAVSPSLVPTIPPVSIATIPQAGTVCSLTNVTNVGFLNTSSPSASSSSIHPPLIERLSIPMSQTANLGTAKRAETELVPSNPVQAIGGAPRGNIPMSVAVQPQGDVPANPESDANSMWRPW